MAFRKLEEVPVTGKRVFIRADLNVPMRDGQITDTTRIDESLQSIKWVIANGGRAIVAAHRAHASTVGMVRFVADRAIGPLMQKEVAALSPLLGSPARPFVVVLGGAKVSDKIGLIRNLLPRCDSLLIGGAMAYTFLAAQGVEVGDSFLARDEIGVEAEVFATAKKLGVEIVLPVDHIVTQEIARGAP